MFVEEKDRNIIAIMRNNNYGVSFRFRFFVVPIELLNAALRDSSSSHLLLFRIIPLSHTV